MRVLIVDDDPDMRFLAAHVLGRGGWEVLEAATGEEGLRKARRDRPDLVLLDLLLEEIEGTEVLEALRSEPRTREVPVIFLTGRSGEEETRRLMESGAAGVIGKPFDPDGLRERIEEILETGDERPREGGGEAGI